MDIQIINDTQGKPAFVVIPYADYMARRDDAKASVIGADGMTPHAVARRMLEEGMSPVRAWREHLDLTQKEMAARLGVSQPSYADQEKEGVKLRKASREKIAAAMGINPELLHLD